LFQIQDIKGTELRIYLKAFPHRSIDAPITVFDDTGSIIQLFENLELIA